MATLFASLKILIAYFYSRTPKTLLSCTQMKLFLFECLASLLLQSKFIEILSIFAKK